MKDMTMTWTVRLKHLSLVLLTMFIAISGGAPAWAQTAAATAEAVPTTVTTFERAETDRYFRNIVTRGGLGRFYHFRQLAPVEAQTVVRVNRDTLYSSAVFDLDAAPVTITLPEAGSRFRSLIAINEDHYAIGVYYGAGSYTFTREQAGTRYLFLALRTFVDPRNGADMDAAHALQDATTLSQANVGSFEVPNWDQTSLTRIRNALNVLMGSLDSEAGEYFGPRDRVDPVLHLIGTATLWGGNPRADAIYLNRFPTENDGVAAYRLTVPRDVPVDAFWSVTVYNAAGYIEPNAAGAYSINNITARRNRNGDVAIQFGDYQASTPNCLPIFAGWNYTVRLYRPRPEVLSGAWRFPQAERVSR